MTVSTAISEARHGGRSGPGEPDARPGSAAVRTSRAAASAADSEAAASLEYRDTLGVLVQLGVRAFSDLCIIDVADKEGMVHRTHAAHATPALSASVASLLAVEPDHHASALAARVIASARPILHADLGAGHVEAIAMQEADLRILHSLQLQSLLAVPLPGSARPPGVMIFGSATRHFAARDVVDAKMLARLAGLEVDNARRSRAMRHALDARDRVLGMVAHDLRNPLNTIVMTADILRTLSLSESERLARLEVILHSADRMNRLIRDLLDVARITGDHIVLECAVESPAAIAGEAIELCAGRAAARSLQLELHAAADIASIHADRDRLLRVLTNLIDNAIRFTPPGGRVAVDVGELEDAVRFTVSDTGSGIAPEDMPHLFRPFWQSPTGPGGGTGLGLAIALGIVTAHGGTITVESTPGEGSTFRFTIPIGPAESRDRRRRHVDRRARQSAINPPGPAADRR